jgi:hypothetical protein
MEHTFSELADQWALHCAANAMSSNSSHYIDCDAVRSLVALGNDALPQIMAVYMSDDHPHKDLWWFFVLERIVYGRDHPGSFSTVAEKENWSRWWDEYRSQV